MEFNEHPQWEGQRDYLQASRPACSTEKSFQKLQKSEGIYRQTEYASRPVHERVREQTAYVSVFLSVCLISDGGKCSYIDLAGKRQCKPGGITVLARAKMQSDLLSKL